MTGRKAWVSDEVLSAADLNGYLMDQAVTIWANASARNSGILSPIKGQLCFLQDVSKYQEYNGSAWVGLIAETIRGITIFNSSTTPTANAAGDLWFY